MNGNELISALTALPLFEYTDHALLASWIKTHALTAQNVTSGTRADHPGVRELGVLLQGRAEIVSLVKAPLLKQLEKILK